MMKVWNFIALVCVWSSVKVAADNFGGCVVRTEDGAEIAPDDWFFDHTVQRAMADDAAPGSVVYTFDVENVISVSPGTPTQPSDTRYVTFRLSGNQLLVEVTDNISTYEQNEVNIGDLNTPLTFQCTGGFSSTFFRVVVAFSNNNAPVFAPETEVVQALPMPYPVGFVAQIVTVADIDMDVKDMELTLDALGQDMFTVTMHPIPTAMVTGKEFKFDVETRREIEITGLTQTVATITCTQNGVSLSAVATLSFIPA